MTKPRSLACSAFLLTAVVAPVAFAVDLSPARWPNTERERLEKTESETWAPLTAQTVEGRAGFVSATVSPLAVRAGVEALRQGGSAADAAATTALTQITTQLGSVVSYAGVFTMLYYEAKTQRVSSLDAGFNSYRGETDPLSIPAGDLGPMHVGPHPAPGGAKGRATLVPGFMAGVETMHTRFGRLPFAELFAPALWYDEHGVVVSPTLAAFFDLRKTFLARTPEGRRFLAQSGGEVPRAGERFIQHDLAETLRAVARGGARAMYTGKWAEDFVTLVQREGGKVTAEDLRDYTPIWSEPYQQTVFGHTIYVTGPPHYGAFGLLTGLNLAEARHLESRGPYWSDRETFRDLARISQFVATSPVLAPALADRLRAPGVDVSPVGQLGKEFARAVAPQLDTLLAPPADQRPKHSNAIVAVDRDGNIAVVTHTINAVLWGDSGLVVGGIPVPDSAGFQQAAFVAIKPGDRVPHQIVDTIVLDGNRPVLATASIGSSLLPENLRVLVGVLGQKQTLAAVMAAPPLLANFTPLTPGQTAAQVAVSVPEHGYDAKFLTALRAEFPNLTTVPLATAAALRGTLAAVALDPKTGARSGADQPGVMVFNGAE